MSEINIKTIINDESNIHVRLNVAVLLIRLLQKKNEQLEQDNKALDNDLKEANEKIENALSETNEHLFGLQQCMCVYCCSIEHCDEMILCECGQNICQDCDDDVEFININDETCVAFCSEESCQIIKSKFK